MFIDQYNFEYVRQWDVTPLRRCSFASSIDEVLEPGCDIVSGLWIPENLLKFVNALVAEALKDRGITAEPTLILQERDNVSDRAEDEELLPVLWHVSSINMWQLLDRRIDECVTYFHATAATRRSAFHFV